MEIFRGFFIDVLCAFLNMQMIHLNASLSSTEKDFFKIINHIKSRLKKIPGLPATEKNDLALHFNNEIFSFCPLLKIPANYWKEISSIKKFERALHNDSIFNNKISACDIFSNQRDTLLQTLSLRDLLSSQDSLLTTQYYDCLAKMFNGSIHQRVLAFYVLRNEQMLKNIRNITRENKKKTIVIVTGDDHFIFLKNKFRNEKFL